MARRASCTPETNRRRFVVDVHGGVTDRGDFWAVCGRNGEAALRESASCDFVVGEESGRTSRIRFSDCRPPKCDTPAPTHSLPARERATSWAVIGNCDEDF